QDVKMFHTAWYGLGLLLIGYFTTVFIQIPVYFVAGVLAIFYIFMARTSPAVSTGPVIQAAPWDVVIFSLGMYVVVYGLGNAGLTTALASLIETTAEQGLFVVTVAMGFIAAFLSSIMNNMPTVMIDALAIAETSTSGVMREALIYGNVIG